MEKELPVRKSIRLRGYDYSQDGAYYITICTQDRANLYGDVIVGADLVSARVELSGAGRMIDRIYTEIVSSFHDVFCDKYIIMPNHFHCILFIKRADTRSAPTAAIGSVVQAFKSKTTVAYINGVKAGSYTPFNKRLWQRNYYEHIIRNEDDYMRIYRYIDENPLKWKEDDYYGQYNANR